MEGPADSRNQAAWRPGLLVRLHLQIGAPRRGCNSDAWTRADGHRQEWDVCSQCAFLLLWEFAGQLQISRKVEDGAKVVKGCRKRGASL